MASMPMFVLSRQTSMEARYVYSRRRAYRRYAQLSASSGFGHERDSHGPPFSRCSRLDDGKTPSVAGSAEPPIGPDEPGSEGQPRPTKVRRPRPGKYKRRRRHGNERWDERKLIFTAILMAYDEARHLKDAFEHVRECMAEMFPGERRVGRTYQGFVKALKRLRRRTVAAIAAHLREQHRRLAGGQWQVHGWVALAADGSRLEMPRTAANEQAFGCAGRDKTGPQLGVTSLYHLGTGLPWAWELGPGTESERVQLKRLLATLPLAALIVADAGFTGFELLRFIIAAGHSFLIRVGANVTLLMDLLKDEDLQMRQEGDVVWLWPQGQRDQPPLKLRLIRVPKPEGVSEDMYLVTNVLDPQQLTDAAATEIYQMRWGVEVMYRAYKQTMESRKLRSAAPQQAQSELHWGLTGLLLLELMALSGMRAAACEGFPDAPSDACPALSPPSAPGVAEPVGTDVPSQASPTAALRCRGAGQRVGDPRRFSVADGVRIVRCALRTSQRWRRRGDLRVLLGQCQVDGYQRKRPKKARAWPHKKNEGPPGAPKIRPATPGESRLATRVCAAA